MGKEDAVAVQHIHILRAPGIPLRAMSVVRSGIVKTLDIAGIRDRFRIYCKGRRRDIRYRGGDCQLLPHRSVDWYIEQGRFQNLSDIPDCVNGGKMIDLLSSGLWQKEQGHLFFFLLWNPIHWSDAAASKIIGLGQRNTGALLSLDPYKRIDVRALDQIFLDAIHEWGHVCGLLPDDRPKEGLVQLFGWHCGTTPCVMQTENRAEDVRNPVFRAQPFCPHCKDDLRRFSLPTPA